MVWIAGANYLRDRCKVPTVPQTSNVDIGVRAEDDTVHVGAFQIDYRLEKPLMFACGKMDLTLSCEQKYCYTGLTEEKKIKFKISKNFWHFCLSL